MYVYGLAEPRHHAACLIEPAGHLATDRIYRSRSALQYLAVCLWHHASSWDWGLYASCTVHRTTLSLAALLAYNFSSLHLAIASAWAD